MSGQAVEPAPHRGSVDIDVLVPTVGRPAALAVTLAGLAGQVAPGSPSFRVVVSSQDVIDVRDAEGTSSPVARPDADTGFPGWSPEVRAMAGILEGLGVTVDLRRHLPRRGLAEHRQALLDAATAPAVLFLDDDVWLQPGLVRRLHAALRGEGCGFVGSAPAGWSYVRDRRPADSGVEVWPGRVQPERVRPDDPAWERHRLHSAANMVHAAERLGLGPGDTVAYKIAWIGGCVLFDTAALRAAGGFGFWRDLPAAHAGEDVVAELRVMERSGGCGILPTGAWHLELPTTVPNREVDAPRIIAL